MKEGFLVDGLGIFVLFDTLYFTGLGQLHPATPI